MKKGDQLKYGDLAGSHMDLIKTRCILGSILVIAEQLHQRIAIAKQDDVYYLCHSKNKVLCSIKQHSLCELQPWRH